MHHFVYNGEKYRIRTIISSVEEESRNELIGRSFLAVDLDQDRIIDQIQLGSIELTKAQDIYDYCLDRLIKENKLIQIERRADYYREYSILFDLEIVTFSLESGEIFNEFTIVDKRIVTRHSINTFQDRKANGILDQKLKGTMLLQDAQLHFTKFIERGLKAGKLIEHEHQFFVQSDSP
ncbi:MAG: hypothetical protein ACRBF0_09350 [Calditrichia bacterium]